MPIHDHLDGADYSVTLGSHVSWYPKAERWRIEIAKPKEMGAVWIAHKVLCGITEVDTLDAELISGLVQIHRTAIEQHIGLAEMENWKEALGVLPQGTDGFYSRLSSG